MQCFVVCCLEFESRRVVFDRLQCRFGCEIKPHEARCVLAFRIAGTCLVVVALLALAEAAIVVEVGVWLQFDRSSEICWSRKAGLRLFRQSAVV